MQHFRKHLTGRETRQHSHSKIKTHTIAVIACSVPSSRARLLRLLRTVLPCRSLTDVKLSKANELPPVARMQIKKTSFGNTSLENKK